MFGTKNKSNGIDDVDDDDGRNDNNNNNNDASSSSIMNELKDPIQWHEYLREAEMVRRQNITIRIRQNQIHRQSLQQLLEDSMSETETAYRLAVGLSTAQEKLLVALRKGLSINNNNPDMEETTNDDKKSKDNKKKSSKRNNKNKDDSTNDDTDSIRKAPPIQSIVVPNDYDNNIVSILEQQHVSLYEHVTNVIPHQKHAAKRIYELAQRSMKYSNKLNDRAKEILSYLEEIENDVQRAWDTYFHAASVLFLKSGTKQKSAALKAAAAAAADNNTNTSNADMYTLGNVWLAELKYRSAVSHQIDEWVKNGSVLQFNFLMAKDSERQRRLRLRQYLHMTIQKQQSIFISSSSSFKKSNNDSITGDGDLWGTTAPVTDKAEGEEDEDGDGDETSRKETTVISNRSNNNLNTTNHSETISITTNHSETTTAQWVTEINKELENQMNEIMKQQLSGQEPNFLISSKSSLYKKRIILQKQREYEKIQQAKVLKQQLKQQEQHEQERLIQRQKKRQHKHKDDTSVDDNDENDEEEIINNYAWSYEIQDRYDTSNNSTSTRLVSNTTTNHINNNKGQHEVDIEERIQEVSTTSGSISFWKETTNPLLYPIHEYEIDLTREGKILPPSTTKRINTIKSVKDIGEASNDETKTTQEINPNNEGKEGDTTSPSTTNDSGIPPPSTDEKVTEEGTKNNKADTKPIPTIPVSTPAEDESMDRLLYSGALLESHYVQYAAVVEMKLEENDGTVMYTQGDTNTVYMAKPGQKGQVVMVMPEDEPPRLCLAVVTTDETLHLFSLPEQSDIETLFDESKSKERTTNDTGSPVPLGSNKPSMPLIKIHLGSSAEDALKTILLQKQLQEKKRFQAIKQKDDAKKAAAEVTDSKKNNRRLRGKQQQQQQQQQQQDEPEEDDKSSNEDNFGLVPFVSMLLTDYTVRMTRRGEFGLKITKNLRPSATIGTTSSTTSNGDDGIDNNNINNKKQLKVRLKLASRDDQMALVSAARGQLTRMEV